MDQTHDVDRGQVLGRVAEQALAAPFLEKLPNGYDTMLGRLFADGQQLSGGQWQKVALARAFVRQAPVVILDEPTAAIDAEAEAEIFGRLREIATNATALLIAHRFSTVRMADHIIVLDQGRAIEQGSHDELLLAEGTYLFTGDHLAWSERLGHLYAFRSACWHDWDELVRSTERLVAEQRFEWVLPGHGRRAHIAPERFDAEVARLLAWLRRA